MTTAKCSFKECGCNIIAVDYSKLVYLPAAVLDDYQLMQSTKSTDVDVNTKGPNTPFTLVTDVWAFDNIGVSKDIPPSIAPETGSQYTFQYENDQWDLVKCVKYMICAECDRGPIGMVCQIMTPDKSEEQMVYMLSLQSVQV
ncbi:guanine nucleotide exchange factor DSS4 KNAG_0D02260 [Huiozyma naganishii CBS 8797]|uniref:Protein DSS4 n=1 Tax=Huiozyma naganishii (strain ATCC MYA-139 / BCRC 22969 / CBS 8797 / KCTC 17520 / NBRC 10181 / NCYC 3082 / Yp74L-3) TaxID=1071383 RepID=J7S6X5_HUIN7|nr:hypothetical protein KNAG_0D02260 [Kazachstania naganishii CBS 8797]CCK69976.1 hypothetical protein KNAG_0D02260 [Kazachstania naganishii CBS 8797]